MRERIREIVTTHGKLASPLNIIGDEGDLFAAGMDSLAVVQVMTHIEDAFDVELPDSMLNRKTFSSIASLESALRNVMAG